MEKLILKSSALLGEGMVKFVPVNVEIRLGERVGILLVEVDKCLALKKVSVSNVE